MILPPASSGLKGVFTQPITHLFDHPYNSLDRDGPQAQHFWYLFSRKQRSRSGAKLLQYHGVGEADRKKESCALHRLSSRDQDWGWQ